MSQMNNQKLVIRLVAIVFSMFGFGFALVPLYDVFCDYTGINGRSIQRADKDASIEYIDTDRTIRVEFVTFSKMDSQLIFRSVTDSVNVHPGEMKDVKFTIKNQHSNNRFVQATPSVSPGQAGLFLNKTECFCFTQQELMASSETEFTMRFFIDKDLPKHVKVLTLAYTLYPIGEQSLAKVL